jgi:hypothetical protein
VSEQTTSCPSCHTPISDAVKKGPPQALIRCEKCAALLVWSNGRVVRNSGGNPPAVGKTAPGRTSAAMTTSSSGGLSDRKVSTQKPEPKPEVKRELKPLVIKPAIGKAPDRLSKGNSGSVASAKPPRPPLVDPENRKFDPENTKLDPPRVDIAPQAPALASISAATPEATPAATVDEPRPESDTSEVDTSPPLDEPQSTSPPELAGAVPSVLASVLPTDSLPIVVASEPALPNVAPSSSAPFSESPADGIPPEPAPFAETAEPVPSDPEKSPPGAEVATPQIRKNTRGINPSEFAYNDDTQLRRLRPAIERAYKILGVIVLAMMLVLIIVTVTKKRYVPPALVTSPPAAAPAPEVAAPPPAAAPAPQVAPPPAAAPDPEVAASPPAAASAPVPVAPLGAHKQHKTGRKHTDDPLSAAPTKKPKKSKAKTNIGKFAYPF